MKRFLIFMLGGPLIAHCLTMGLLSPLSPTEFVVRTLANLGNILLVGAIPALLICLIDVRLERSRAWRAAFCAIAACASSYIPLLFVMAVFSHWPGWSTFLQWGVGGLVAGALCSWLSWESRIDEGAA